MYEKQIVNLLDAIHGCKTYTKVIKAKYVDLPGELIDLKGPFNENGRCRNKHPKEVCKCHFPVYKIGQDEAAFKQNVLPAYYWSFKGREKLRPKTEGQAIMISVTFDETGGWGLPVTEEERTRYNAWADANGRPSIHGRHQNIVYGGCSSAFANGVCLEIQPPSSRLRKSLYVCEWA